MIQIDLWFSGFSKPATPADPSAPYPYDRLANLKDAFFDIFADDTTEPQQLDYVNMVRTFNVIHSGNLIVNLSDNFLIASLS